MANGAALALLGRFIREPSKINASRLVLIPSLLNVLLFHDGQYPSDVLNICAWLHDQGRTLLEQLTVHESESPRILEELDWKKVSSHAFINITVLTTLLFQDRVLLQPPSNS